MFVAFCNVCVVASLVMSWCLCSLPALPFASLSALAVMVVLLVRLFRLLCLLDSVVICYVLFVCWLVGSCLGVCDRCMLGQLILCLRWLC